jgi:hypothetical protein
MSRSPRLVAVLGLCPPITAIPALAAGHRLTAFTPEKKSADKRLGESNVSSRR